MMFLLKETCEVRSGAANQSTADTDASNKIKFTDFIDYFLVYYHCTNLVRAMRKTA